MDVATARARMARRAEAVKKYIGELKDAIEEKDLSTVEMRWINDVSGCLVSERERFGDLAEVVLDEEVDEDLMQKDAVSIAEFKTSVQTALSQATVCHSMKALDIATQLLETNLRRLEQHFDLDPEKNYAASLKLCCQLQDSLVVTIGTSCLRDEHPRRVAADKDMTKYLELTAKVNKPHKVAGEAKPRLSAETGLGGMKYALHSTPTFSGQQKDYPSFWAEFKQIHTTPHFSDAAKLAYLRQGQLDPDIRKRLSDNIENGDGYAEVVEKFQRQFDKPRQMHKIYVDSLVQLSQVKPSRSAILDCVNTVNSAINGLNRLGQCDVESFVTSLVEELLPLQLRAKWADHTLGAKKVPPISKLLEFMEQRADQPQYLDKTPSVVEKKFGLKQKVVPKKGSVNVSVTQPIQVAPPTVEPQAGRPVSVGKGQQRPIAGSFPIRYACPDCREAHYAFSCPKFKEKTVAQRKSFVIQHALCFNCLKPGHGVGECRNRTECRVCEGRHHVMLHQEGGSAPPTVVGTVNTIHSNG